ncbi:MAG: carbohydrate ABC transporter permease, partial [Candidatus Thorarchaeota archaeon]
KFKPGILVIIGITSIFLVVLMNDILQGTLGRIQDGVLGYRIVDIPKIQSTFWITDDVYIFGYQFKMITFSAILINVWLGVPFMMLSFLATLQSIPNELYEAAEIDGLSSWGQFKKVTLPLLKPTLLTVSLLGIIWTFNLFNVVYLLSQNQTGIGDPVYYDIFVTFIYTRFNPDREYSQASALSLTVFIILISFSLVYRKLIKTEELWEAKT